MTHAISFNKNKYGFMKPRKAFSVKNLIYHFLKHT